MLETEQSPFKLIFVELRFATQRVFISVMAYLCRLQA